MQSSLGDHNNFELDFVFDGEQVKKNPSPGHMRTFAGPGQELSSRDHLSFCFLRFYSFITKLHFLSVPVGMNKVTKFNFKLDDP